MRATILPQAIILTVALTKAHRTTVRIMAKVCIMLPRRCFLLLLPAYNNILVCFIYLDYF